MDTLGTKRDRLRRILGGGSVALIAPSLGLIDLGGHPVADALSLALLAISLGVHEAAHAWSAWRCGDPTARNLGRMTINPIPHIDLMWTIVIPAFFLLTSGFLFGGAKPVPVDFRRLRHPLRDMSLVALAGPASNLLLAILFLFLANFFLGTGWYNGAAETPFERTRDLLPMVLHGAVGMNILLFVFNLIPIPPLDGSRVLTWILPEGLRPSYAAIGPFGLAIVFALMLWGPLGSFVAQAQRVVFRLIDGIVPSMGAW
jgi:Zn-dependent protease